MIQKDLQGNLWECKIGTMSSGKTAREKTIGEDLSERIIEMENAYVDIVRKRDKEIEELNYVIKKAIHFINLNQDPKKLTLNYDDLKKLRGILNNDDYYLRLFEEQLKELKENSNE